MPQEVINGNTRIWRYDFSSYSETGWGFFSYFIGCESGQRFEWYDWSFGVFGTRAENNVRKDYAQQKPRTGGC